MYKKRVSHSVMSFYDPMDCSPPGSAVHEILQARILEWVAFPSPGDLPDPSIEPRSPTLKADSIPSEPPAVQACYLFYERVCLMFLILLKKYVATEIQNSH